MAEANPEIDLSEYIDADKLAKMSDLERRCCANQIKNYNMMKSIGIYSRHYTCSFQTFMRIVLLVKVVFSVLFNSLGKISVDCRPV